MTAQTNAAAQAVIALELIGTPSQSLALGAAGQALLFIEDAATGHSTWTEAHKMLEATTWDGITATPDAHLYYGAPALAFAITGAHRHRPDSYIDALASLDDMVTKIVYTRLAAAHARIDAGRLPALSEFDTIRGLAGLGAHLLRRDPTTAPLREVLCYLVRLTEPIHDDGDELPGWWTHLDPGGDLSPDFPGGHANTGMAHGIGGPLALLALTANRGITVPGHTDAINRIRDWLDRWQQIGTSGPWRRRTSAAGTWWPYWITRRELRTGRLKKRGTQRPSWCYGTPGLARAQQLAATATGDTSWKHIAETALADALTDPHQLNLLTGNSLCHGLAGTAHIARLLAADSTSDRLRRVAEQITASAVSYAERHPTAEPMMPGWNPGFLEGDPGTELALRAALTDSPPATHWDTCLLINAPA